MTNDRRTRKKNGLYGYAYEIVAQLPHQVNRARTAIRAWKKSSGHNRVMVNEGPWKSHHWNAVGIGISERYSAIWFGVLPDASTQEVIDCPIEKPQTEEE